MAKVDNYKQALQELVHYEFLKSMTYKEYQHRANKSPDWCDPDILEFERRFISKLKSMGIPFFAVHMLRTPEQQRLLYEQGRTTEGEIVTKAGPWESAHNYGMAVDLVHGVYAWDIDDRSWEIIGHIGKEVAAAIGVEITWGGDWGWDHAHWELSDWKERVGRR